MTTEIKQIEPGSAVVKYSNGEIVLPAEVIASLPVGVKKVIASKETPCIADFTTEGLDERVSKLISGLYQDAGQTIDGKDLAVFTYRLCRELQDIKFLHFGELEEACRHGLKGAYGQNFGINLISVMRWISGYKDSQDHKQYAYEISKLIGHKSAEPSEEEKNKIAQNLALKSFEDFKSGIDISAPAVTVYDYLDSIGKVKFTKDQKIVFYKDAHVEVKKELAAKASKTNNKQESSEMKNLIRNIGNMQAGVAEGDDKVKILIKNEAKRLALKSYFADLIEFELTLEF
jgi:hypothetical protein